MTDYPVSLTVAANMKRYRRQRGWTQEDLGEKLGGWSKAVVSAAETMRPGRVRAFKVDELVLIADALGVSVMDMITPKPPCVCCKDEPPAGMTCEVCGTKGTPFTPAGSDASEPGTVI